MIMDEEKIPAELKLKLLEAEKQIRLTERKVQTASNVNLN